MIHYHQFIFILLAIFVLESTSFAGWLIYSKPDFKGRILDAETKEPIKGVVVTAAYWADAVVGGPGGGNSKIIHIKESLKTALFQGSHGG